MHPASVRSTVSLVYQTRRDEWRLTAEERKRILLEHIYGVDIDAQAVEVTKLSLLLKVLEGEAQERRYNASCLRSDVRYRICLGISSAEIV